MAGIYIHIPFCRKACHYCNFHFSTLLAQKPAMVDAIIHELQLQANYLKDLHIDTIYLGGGTPSLLSAVELKRILDAIHLHYAVSPNPETTLEANPEDISSESLGAWHEAGINRLSIGVQGFQDEMLRNWNRAHNATQAKDSLPDALAAGFDNISVDLIYGAPDLTDKALESNLDIITSLGIAHLSCYALTVETGTALHHQIKTGKAKPVDDEKSYAHFHLIQQRTQAAGYMQYEVSNFCKPGFLSQHNTSYWKGIAYLGVGPAAHSFNGVSRQWNIANNALYIRSLEQRRIPFEVETLTPDKRYNEMVMTGFRTMWGVDRHEIDALDGPFSSFLDNAVQPFINEGKIIVDEDHYILHPQQYFFADGIASELFFV